MKKHLEEARAYSAVIVLCVFFAYHFSLRVLIFVACVFFDTF